MRSRETGASRDFFGGRADDRTGTGTSPLSTETGVRMQGAGGTGNCSGRVVAVVSEQCARAAQHVEHTGPDPDDPEHVERRPDEARPAGPADAAATPVRSCR